MGPGQRVPHEPQHPAGWRELMFDNLVQDVRYAARQLVRTPLFTVIAAVSLAVGIAVAVGVFSLINSMLFKPIGVPDADLIVHLYTSHGHSPYGAAAYADLEDFRESGAFVGATAYQSQSFLVSVDHREPRRREIIFADPEYFEALGVRVRGRTLSTAGDDPVIVISQRFRERNFDSDQDVLGATVVVNRVPFTIIGVATEGFRGFEPWAEVAGWIAPSASLHFDHWSSYRQLLQNRSFRGWRITGRLAPGVRAEAAMQRLEATSQTLSAEYPAWRDDDGQPLRVTLLSQRRSIVRPDDFETMAALATITALVIVVLLLSCANVAGLLLARSITRSHEIAVRLALGASRSRLLTQVFTESIFLGLLGGALGCFAATRALRLLSRSTVFEAFDLSIDWRVVMMTVTVSTLCALIFGTTPAAQALRIDVKRGLKGLAVVGERGNVRGRLIALQVCLSSLLLLLAFSASRGLRSQLSGNTGIEMDGVVVAQLELNGFRGDSAARKDYINTAEDALNRMPGVTSVSVAPRLPFSGIREAGLNVQSADGTAIRASLHRVRPGYFETLGIQVLEGRAVRREDLEQDHITAVVNRAFAVQYGGNVVGATVEARRRQYRVVGIVEDVKHYPTDTDRTPQIYIADPRSSMWQAGPTIMARVASGNEQDVSNALARVLRDEHPDRVITAVAPLRTTLATRLAPQRYASRIALGIGALELVLAALGLYSLLLYALHARTREVGLRMALGATPGNASFTVIREGLQFVAAGTVLGIAVCLPAARFAAGTFVGAKAGDWIPFAASMFAIACASAAAAFGPALRAARIEPMTALRHE